MWRVHTSKQGRQILEEAKRRFASRPIPGPEKKAAPAPAKKAAPAPAKQAAPPAKEAAPPAKEAAPPAKEAAPPAKPSLKTPLPPKSSAGAPPPPPPPRPVSAPPRKSFGLLKLLGLTLPVVGGATVGYAWYDPHFRKQLEENIPYSQELLSLILSQPEIAEPPKIEDVELKPIAPALDVVSLPPAINEPVQKEEEEPKAVEKPPEEPEVVSVPAMANVKLMMLMPEINGWMMSLQNVNWLVRAKCSVEQEQCFSYCDPTMDRTKPKVRYWAKRDENKKFAEVINPLKGEEPSDVSSVQTENTSQLPADEGSTDNDSDNSVQTENTSHLAEDEGSADSNSVPTENTSLLTEDGGSAQDNSVQTENTSLLAEEVERMLCKKMNPNIDPTQYLSYPVVSYLCHNQAKSFTEAASQETQPVVKEDPVKIPEETYVDIAAAMKSKEEAEQADNAALEVALHKLLERSEAVIQETVKAQLEVVGHTKQHVKLLKQAMDDTDEVLKKDDQWKAVALAYKEKENAALRSTDLVNESKRSIEKIQDLLASSKENSVTQTNPAIYPATKKVVELTNAIGAANAQVRQAESEARVMLKYKDLVDRGKKQFQDELESLLPDVKLGTSSKKLTEDELNALIAHAHRRIEQLQKQLAEQMSMERQRLSRALEVQRVENQSITLGAVADEHLRLQSEFASEKHKMELDFLIQQEEEVRKQLGRQAAAHSDHIKDVLSVQREQLSLDHQRELNTKILEEREEFQTEVASWLSRIRGIEAAIDGRAQSEHLARCAQDLWLACIALNSAISYGAEDDPEARIPVQKQIDNILKVGQKHPFVETVANTLPEKVLKEGVYTEEQLRNRFIKVSKVCRRLGLITESNASLQQYLISFLHSIVVFDRVVASTASDQVDLNALDNYGLVAHAQYFMTQGDLESAVRFMCQLTGESKVAAADWLSEAKLLLETRQVATSLTAYASATGLANTF